MVVTNHKRLSFYAPLARDQVSLVARPEHTAREYSEQNGETGETQSWL